MPADASTKSGANGGAVAKSAADGKAAKKKPTLEKSRRKEVKGRLNAEASREIRPLAVGTLAMMASALSNQGMCIQSLHAAELLLIEANPAKLLCIFYQSTPQASRQVAR